MLTFTTNNHHFEQLKIYGEFTDAGETERVDIMNIETGEVLCYSLNCLTINNLLNLPEIFTLAD